MPKQTPIGLLYDMDKIICVKSTTGEVHFYTAKYDPIDNAFIKKFS